MSVPVPSYVGKVYAIENNNAVLRDPANIETSLKDSRGRKMVIPMMTQVRVTDVRTGDKRNVFVFAEPVDKRLPTTVTGWTSATNLRGEFLNELVGYVPPTWTLEPRGTGYTVTDADAVIRQASPPYRAVSPRATLPVGTEVIVTARSEGTNPVGKYVHVSHGEIKNGKASLGEPIGVTAASNLTPGWSPFFRSEKWTSQKGDNACWRKGEYIGAKVLVSIVGTGGQMQRIALDLVAPFLKLKDAASESHIRIGVNSGFRSFAKQDELFRLFKKGRGNRAARPGTSNHQHGQALDLSTHGFDGDPVYDWMKNNGPKFGFVRTVSGEHWHWEYRPDEASRLAKKGRFKLDGVRV